MPNLSTLILALTLAAPAPAAPDALRGQVRAKSELWDFSLTFAPAKAGLHKGFWVGVGMDEHGKGYAAFVRESKVELFRRPSKLLARCALPRGAWTKPRCTLTIMARPRRLLIDLDGERLLSVHTGALPGDWVGVTGLPKRALLAKPDLRKRERPYLDEDFFETQNVADDWTVEMGKWGFEAPVDPLIALNEDTPMYALYVAQGEHSVATAGYRFWDLYAAEVTCQVRTSDYAGLAVYWLDKANYAALELHRDAKTGRCSPALIWVRGGKRHRVASADEFDARQWHRLRLEAADDRAWGYVDGQLVVHAKGMGLHRGKVGLCAGKPGAAFDDVAVRPFDAETLPAPGSSTLPATWSGVRVLAQADCAAQSAISLEDRSAGARFDLRIEPKHKRCGLWLVHKGGAKLCAVRALPSSAAALTLSAVRGRVVATLARERVGVWRLEEFTPSRFALAGGKHAWARAEPWQPKRALLYQNAFDKRIVPSKADNGKARVLGDELRLSAGRWAIKIDAAGSGKLLVWTPPAALWLVEPCPGDVRAGVDALAVDKSVVLGIAGDRGHFGYSAKLAPNGNSLRLGMSRQGKEVAAKVIHARLPARLSIERDGRFVVASCRGQRIVWRDAARLTGDRVGISADGKCALDNLRIENLNAWQYRFERLSADWREAGGAWSLHSGMTCIPWSYWLTGDGRKTQAALWWKGKLPADFAVQFDVCEFTLGTNNPKKTHFHYPYHDVTLALCADGKDLHSGYAIEVGADGGRRARLRRKGKVLAQSDAFTIVMGSHCNKPRQVRVYVRKLGPRLTVDLNGRRFADITDAHALRGGSLAIAVKGCRANFSDVLIAPE